MDLEAKTIPNTKKEHLERSTQAPASEGSSTQAPTSEGSRTQAPTNEGSSTQAPVSEAPTIPKSGTQSTFNPDLEAPKGAVDSDESSTSGTTFSGFLDKLFDNF